MIDAETIAKALGGKRSGTGWICKCVAHDDSNPSMSIADGDKGGVVVKCHKGCDQRELIHRLMARDLWPVRKNGAGKQIVATYDYTDENGKLVYQVVRFAPKDFRQRRPDGKGWIWNLKGIKPVPYRLPELLEAIKAGKQVFVVEGEKDVETLRKHGFVATCNSGGAGKWTEAHAQYLKGADVIVIPDNDQPGRRHAELVGESLRYIAERIDIIPLEGRKDVSEWFEKGGTYEDFRYETGLVRESGEELTKTTSTDTKIDGAALLEDVRNFLRRFVAFPSEHCLTAAALWAAHSHAVEHFHTTPRLAALSPEPESGKTRMLEILNLLTPNSMLILSPSVAAIFRKLAQEQVTLLFDEVDTIFTARGKDDQNEDLRALLNAGYRRGASIPRCTGKNYEVTDFSVFAAAALAGIGNLPDTVTSRSIVVRMRRRAATEHIEQYRHRIHDHEGHALRDRLAAWAAEVGAAAGSAWPVLPDGIEDRKAECWEPLISIADAAGGEWPQRARASAVSLVSATSRTPTLGVQLLMDLRKVFADREVVFTTEILKALTSMEESPWSDLKGKPLDAGRLSRFLSRYDVRPKQVRVGAVTAKGYRREDLHDPWLRYLDTHLPEAETPETPETSAVPPVSPVSPVSGSSRTPLGTDCVRCAGEGCGWCT